MSLQANWYKETLDRWQKYSSTNLKLSISLNILITLKRRKIIAISIITIVAISLILVAYNSYRNTQVDTSWVETANSMLQDYPAYVNDSEDSLLAGFRLFLLENGSSRFFYFGSKDAFCNYLINLLKQASIQKGTMSYDELDQVLSSGKAVEIICRFFISVQSHHYSEVYFILESTQNQDMEGTIIVKDNQSSNLNILAVSKLPKFP